MMPNVGCACSISAMLMVNSGLPLMKPLVPSRGSTRKKRSEAAGKRPLLTASSATAGMPGASRCRPRRIMSSAARSAMVTGLRSAFLSTATPGPKWDISKRAAVSTTSKRPSARDFASLTSMPCLDGGAFRPSTGSIRRVSPQPVVTKKQYLDRLRVTALAGEAQSMYHSNAYAQAVPLARVPGRALWSAIGPPQLNQTRGPAMAQGAEPTDLELAALISSKICHDVIGPVGAIYNGLEILDEDDDAEAKSYAMDVIRNVTEQASARLQFARFAFGAAGSAGAQIDLATAEQISRGLLGKGKHKLTWRAKPGQMAKDRVKLLLNLIASAITALPRGGDIEVLIQGTMEHPNFQLRCRGTGARPPQYLVDYVAGGQSPPLDAMSIQAYYTWRLAASARMRLAISRDAGDILLAARPLG